MNRCLWVKASPYFIFTHCHYEPSRSAPRRSMYEKRIKHKVATQAVKAKVNTDLHLCLHHINLIYCVLHKQVKGEGKKRKCGVRTRSRARGNVRFDNTRQSFREILLSGKSLDAANLSFWPPLNRLIHLTSSKVPLFLFFASVFFSGQPLYTVTRFTKINRIRHTLRLSEA